MLDHDNLEDFEDAENYDLNENDTGVAFYTALAHETGGPVLELACGTGRVCIPIAQQGFAVTGLDTVPGMLDQARRKARDLPIQWVEGDARAFDLGELFRLIFLTGNAFQLFLTNADQRALLERVQAHLDDDGLFAFETRNPFWDAPPARAEQEVTLDRARRRGDFVPFLESRDEEHVRTYTDITGRDVRESLAQAYDPVAQILHVTSSTRWREGNQEQTKVTRLALRFTFPQELVALLHCSGFTIIRHYGDWNHEPLSAASTSIIVVCRKRT